MSIGGAEIDGVLVQWGERLFYPRSRIARASPHRLDLTDNYFGAGSRRVSRAGISSAGTGLLKI